MLLINLKMLFDNCKSLNIEEFMNDYGNKPLSKLHDILLHYTNKKIKDDSEKELALDYMCNDYLKVIVNEEFKTIKDYYNFLDQQDDMKEINIFMAKVCEVMINKGMLDPEKVDKNAFLITKKH